MLLVPVNNYVRKVSSPNHTFFLGKLDKAVNQYFVHILSLVTDNNPSRISRRERNHLFHDQSTWKYGTGPGSNSRPLDLQSDTLPTGLSGAVIYQSETILHTILTEVRVKIWYRLFPSLIVMPTTHGSIIIVHLFTDTFTLAQCTCKVFLLLFVVMT